MMYTRLSLLGTSNHDVYEILIIRLVNHMNTRLALFNAFRNLGIMTLYVGKKR